MKIHLERVIGLFNIVMGSAFTYAYFLVDKAEYSIWYHITLIGIILCFMIAGGYLLIKYRKEEK